MKVVAIPRNGLGNRLQMLASCSILASDLNADLEIIWQEQEIFRSDFSSIFDSIGNARIVESGAIEKTLRSDFPNFTSYDSETNTISLKNLRIGDQAFMPKLRRLLKATDSSTRLIVFSGEKFLINQKPSFNDSSEFRSMRQSFYNSIQFSRSANLLIDDKLKVLGRNFWAIHLRATDRSTEVVSLRKIVDAIHLSDSSLNLRGRSVYIASDDQKRGLHLSSILTNEGFQVCFFPEINRNRLSKLEALDSVVDWFLLSKAQHMFSYGSTTYSYEAAVAGGIFESRTHIAKSSIEATKRSVQKELLDFKLYRKLPGTTVFLGKKKN